MKCTTSYYDWILHSVPIFQYDIYPLWKQMSNVFNIFTFQLNSFSWDHESFASGYEEINEINSYYVHVLITIISYFFVILMFFWKINMLYLLDLHLLQTCGRTDEAWIQVVYVKCVYFLRNVNMRQDICFKKWSHVDTQCTMINSGNSKFTIIIVCLWCFDGRYDV